MLYFVKHKDSCIEGKFKVEAYRIEELAVGMEKNFQTAVTEEKIQMFTALSGDINPLHLDDDFAKKQGYPSRIVYGMLTASFYSTLAGVYLPGENCLLYKVDSKFIKPVFLGDTLTICGKIVEVNLEYNFIRVKASVRNQNGEIVSKAKIMAGVLQGEK